MNVNIPELVGLFVIGLIAGLSLAMFVKTVLKVFLFFTGFYILITGLLWYLGLIQFTISWNDVYNYVVNIIRGLGSNSGSISDVIIKNQKYLVCLIGGVIGFFVGVKKL